MVFGLKLKRKKKIKWDVLIFLLFILNEIDGVEKKGSFNLFS